jgi:YkoY family integral membrane protein
MWGLTVPDLTLVAGTIVMLVFLEGLLSADNALVLAAMVRHLPRSQQGRALRYGIFGAFGFRLIAVLFASTLLRYWAFKVVGGIYLLYLAISHLFFGDDDGAGSKEGSGRGFWATVIGVEVADIAFSIDSIVAAVAMAAGLPPTVAQKVIFTVVGYPITMQLAIVYVGGILGIVAMRFVAGYFLKLLDRFAGLASGAYYLVAWIGLKLVGSGFHDALFPPIDVPKPAWHAHAPAWAFRVPLEMPWWLFWAGMVLIVVVSLVVHPKHQPTVQPPLTEEEILA